MTSELFPLFQAWYKTSAMDWTLRLAQESDIPALEKLIPLSVRSLQAPYYSPAQIEGALGSVFGVDRQLIDDRTYFIAEQNSQIVGCGGWSKRKSLFGSDQGRENIEDVLLYPERDSARIRAFFVHPAFARRGIGRAILKASEAAIIHARYRTVELVATLAGEPLYVSFGYISDERYEIGLPNGLLLSVVRMKKQLRA